MSSNRKLMISNVQIYWDIASEEYSQMRSSLEAHRIPRPDGVPGYILTQDPDRCSFKAAMIVIAFCGMYFEAITYLTAQTKFGKEEALKIDRQPYEIRLESIGINDPELAALAKEFRDIRKELVHEKAEDISQNNYKPLRTAQDMAEKSMHFIQRVRSALYDLTQVLN